MSNPLKSTYWRLFERDHGRYVYRGLDLKADHLPDPPLDPKKQRREYIRAVRRHVMERRSERLKEFIEVTHPGLLDCR